MSKLKAAKLERPKGGGSYVRDPKSGKLMQLEGTKPAEIGHAPVEAPEPSAGPAIEPTDNPAQSNAAGNAGGGPGKTEQEG